MFDFYCPDVIKCEIPGVCIAAEFKGACSH